MVFKNYASGYGSSILANVSSMADVPKAEGGPIETPKYKMWHGLSQAEKSEMMKVAVMNGITNLQEIRKKYNEFAEEGNMPDEDYYTTMYKVAKENNPIWNAYRMEEGAPELSVDAEYTRVLNDNTYDYRGYYNKYPDSKTNADTHWTDEFKTVWHPTFSIESKYSGKKSEFNPLGLEGGIPEKDGMPFIPTSWQRHLDNRYDIGGPLINIAMGNVYDEGGIFSSLWNKLYGKVKILLTTGASQNQKTQVFAYRNRPAEKATTNPFIKEGTLVPLRIRPNTSPTKADSEILEDMMRSYIVNQEKANGSSNPEYDLPFIPEKSIIIDGSTTSTNILDSLAKYAGIHNRNPQLSEFPRKKRSSYGFPRKINKNEMLGLSTQETHNGAMPIFNYADNDQDKKKSLDMGYKEYNRTLGNANYLTAFGYIPAENLVRNFQYNKANVNRATPPLLDAFRYYAQGDYNTGDQKHTQNVINKGFEAWEKPSVQNWWETSGKYWYNKGKGPK